MRMLEIGPGNQRIQGFETLDISGGNDIDYIVDAMKALPFGYNTFDVIYAGHVLEHIPWYLTVKVLMEWKRILKPKGRLEVWVPDGLKICKALVDFELHGDNYIEKDGWYRYNPEQEVCRWASGRIFAYGDGTENTGHPNWHRALFTPRYLKQVFETAGFTNIRLLDKTEIRGYDHGWINLGIVGEK